MKLKAVKITGSKMNIDAKQGWNILKIHFSGQTIQTIVSELPASAKWIFNNTD